MYRLDFALAHDYSESDGSILIPVVIRSGASQIPLAATLDTGAAFCLFGAEIAEALDLDLTSGIRKRFRTANSGFDAYGHEVEISALGITTRSMVYFFADPAIDKNVLGRTGWLDRLRVGLVHHDNRLYLAPYDSV